MNSVQLLEELLSTSRLITEKYVKDLSFDELCLPPTLGANPIIWQLGHLIVSEVEMVQRLTIEDPITLPVSFLNLHRKNALDQAASAPTNDTWRLWLDQIRSLYSKEDYLKFLTETRAKSIDVLRTLPSEDLVKPAPVEMARYAKTWASVFVMIGVHETQHAGQIAVLRRSLGKQIVI